ncbi:MAG: sigma-70 family RNA polymerase sigma factor [Chloroflexi bacterium]|nr:sigma-70 family RNA polymerase sigma factor [Chloroflexota bacterium]
MNGKPDHELLRDYAERGVETAFGELVRRHIDLVYSAAVRLVVDRHLAEDVTQAVFVALAQNAWKLAGRSVLSSWLHLTTRNLAAKTVRTEVRRRSREQEATAMQANSSKLEPVWDNIAPHLDEALSQLGDADRDAIMLRFFERKNAREIGERLGLSEEAAQKRVTRALERLREVIRSRGVVVPSAALAGAISSQAVLAAPAGLAATLAAQALASSILKPLTLVAHLNAKPIATTVAVLTCLSLGTGGYLTGRTAAAKHWSAVAWQNAMIVSTASNPPKPAVPPNTIPNPPAPNPVPRHPSVTEVLASAAGHFRASNTDPDAWAKGSVVLEQLRPEDTAEALRELERYRSERGVFGAMAPVLMGLWAKTDPRAALEHALTQLPGDTVATSFEHVCRAWAEQDPAAAWTWFRQTTDSGQRPIRQDTWQWLAKDIFEEWVARDAAGAVNQLASLSFADQQSAIFGIAAAATEPNLRPEILTAIAGLADEGQKRRVAERVAKAWAKLEPEAAAQWTASLPFENPSARLQVMGKVAEEWWPLDPHATARWLLANAPAGLRDQVAEFIRRAPRPAPKN